MCDIRWDIFVRKSGMIKTESVYTRQRFVGIQKQKCNTTGKNQENLP